MQIGQQLKIQIICIFFLFDTKNIFAVDKFNLFDKSEGDSTSCTVNTIGIARSVIHCCINCLLSEVCDGFVFHDNKTCDLKYRKIAADPCIYVGLTTSTEKLWIKGGSATTITTVTPTSTTITPTTPTSTTITPTTPTSTTITPTSMSTSTAITPTSMSTSTTATPTSGTVTPPVCSKGGYKDAYQGTVYKLHKHSKKWDKALDECLKDNAWPVYVPDAAKLNHLIDNVLKKETNTWVGLYRDDSSVDFNQGWKWYGYNYTCIKGGSHCLLWGTDSPGLAGSNARYAMYQQNQNIIDVGSDVKSDSYVCECVDD